MLLYTVASVIISFLVVQKSNAISSPIQPFINYTYYTELQSGVADLWWSVDETKQDILFELHIKTTGWIALGISPGIAFIHKNNHSFLPFPFVISWWNDRC